MSSRQASPCNSIRELVSRSLDCEPSELERRLIGAHVDACVACAEFQYDIRVVTEALRTARLEPVPAPVSVSRRVLGRRVQVRSTLQTASVAAAFIAVVSVALSQPAPGNEARPSGAVRQALSDDVTDTELLSDLHVDAVVNGGLQIVAPTEAGGIGAVKPVLPAVQTA